MGVKKKRAWRERASVWAVYGVPPGIVYTYEVEYALWLQLDRVRLANAESVQRGVAAARTTDALDWLWYDATVPTEPEALPAMAVDTFQRAKARLGFKDG